MGAAVFFGFVLIVAIVMVTIIAYMVYGMYLGLAGLVRVCKQMWLHEQEDVVGVRERENTGEIKEQSEATIQHIGSSERCWEIKQCSPSIRYHCPAYNRQDVPCWQAWMDAGNDAPLRPECLACRLFNLTTLITQ